MFGQVTSTPLPPYSALHARFQPGDFVDCYSVASSLPPRAAAEIVVAFPGWAMALVKLRGLLVAPFGLSNSGPEAEDKLGLFPVEEDTAQELIAGFDDKHLDFRVSVTSHEGRVSLATWVHPHNIWGRLYLATILPAHILIVRNALSRVAHHQMAGQTT